MPGDEARTTSRYVLKSGPGRDTIASLQSFIARSSSMSDSKILRSGRKFTKKFNGTQTKPRCAQNLYCN